jgi:hypothetical protein
LADICLGREKEKNDDPSGGSTFSRSGIFFPKGMTGRFPSPFYFSFSSEGNARMTDCFRTARLAEWMTLISASAWVQELRNTRPDLLERAEEECLKNATDSGDRDDLRDLVVSLLRTVSDPVEGFLCIHKAQTSYLPEPCTPAEAKEILNRDKQPYFFYHWNQKEPVIVFKGISYKKVKDFWVAYSAAMTEAKIPMPDKRISRRESHLYVNPVTHRLHKVMELMEVDKIPSSPRGVVILYRDYKNKSTKRKR